MDLLAGGRLLWRRPMLDDVGKPILQRYQPSQSTSWTMAPTQSPSPGDRKEPSLKAGVVTEMRQFSKRQQEGLLHYVFSISRTAQRSKCSTINRLTVTEDELPNCRRVPAQGSLDEFVVGHTWCRDALWRLGWQFQALRSVARVIAYPPSWHASSHKRVRVRCSGEAGTPSSMGACTRLGRRS